VAEHADDVSVLRRGALVASGAVAELSAETLAAAMVGEGKSAVAATFTREARAAGAAATTRLHVHELVVSGDRGERAVHSLGLTVNSGEIVGVAGVSGNGQRELMEALVGQRAIDSGSVTVGGESCQPRTESPPESAQPARRTLAQCLRRRIERGPQHGFARV
jgi:ABC-type uncharacterized transport system ATPase subunit